VEKVGGENGETDGGGMCRIHCLIRLITLLGKALTSSSSLSHGGEINGLVCNSSLLPFL